MKQLLLHGPAINSSRKKLIELKQKFDPNHVVVYPEGTDWLIIKTAVVSQALFADRQLVIVENLSSNFSFDSSDSSDSMTLLLWFNHEIDSKKWPGFESLLFPEAKEISVFPFLDCLAAKDQKAFIEMEKLKKGGFDIFYSLTMVFYLLRSLAVTPKNAPQFVKDKLQRQRKNFSAEKIIGLYKQLLEIDFKLKSGKLEKPQAEFLLIQNFLEITS